MRKTHVASTGDIDWERKATATATASRGNNKAINNKAKCWGGTWGGTCGAGWRKEATANKDDRCRRGGAGGVFLGDCAVGSAATVAGRSKNKPALAEKNVTSLYKV